MQRTVPELLAAGKTASPAILWDGSGGIESLTYGQLRETVARLSGQIRSAGILETDRVAIVLPNGPAAAVAFLAVACAAVAAPLNPALRPAEVASAITDLGARAAVLLPGTELSLPAGVEGLDMAGEPSKFWLERNGVGLLARDRGVPRADSVALVLSTSGTTARPKCVPLTHANLTASAGNIARTLALVSGDRSLNVMPLFHIHGLVGVLLSTIAAGGSVACMPGFDGFAFFGQIDRFRPTWYSAVPTVHQLVAERSARNPGTLREAGLRFVRSSSAALPVSVMEAIERETGAPMIEAYGMTEAAHQMCSNPLPPGRRKPGSVGLGGTVGVAVLAADGGTCEVGERGEVAVRGDNVFSGYENNSEANLASFSDGWFRTGDEGYFDGEGYLFLTGRLKELINRGGEKVSPAEVEDVLLRHAAVAEAVVFALPHARLGEDVGAAVVLREGTAATERDLREHAAGHLADFKVPRRVFFLESIPKGPTGKLQRIGLAARLGLAPADETRDS